MRILAMAKLDFLDALLSDGMFTSDTTGRNVSASRAETAPFTLNTKMRLGNDIGQK